jgi:hypothetical protein
MRTMNSRSAIRVLFMISIALASTQVQAQDRNSLPIPAPERPAYTELDVRDTKAPQG